MKSCRDSNSALQAEYLSRCQAAGSSAQLSNACAQKHVHCPTLWLEGCCACRAASSTTGICGGWTWKALNGSSSHPRVAQLPALVTEWLPIGTSWSCLEAFMMMAQGMPSRFPALLAYCAALGSGKSAPTSPYHIVHKYLQVFFIPAFSAIFDTCSIQS